MGPSGQALRALLPGQRAVIFVTVGTDLPFNRLVRAVDQWAQSTSTNDVFAQIGDTDWQPSHIGWCNFLQPPEFTRRFAEAEVVVAHAGMGTILSALQWEKPLLVMPRRASLGEQRNEHQLATAHHLSELDKINVAMDEIELRASLDSLHKLQAREKIDAYASESLIMTLRNFIEG
jgi:UDP-N-acetylglucosamine transferase subunit ALG13